MIQIDIWSNALQVSGHADSAPYGQDLVCAGVSSIVMGALNWFDDDQSQLVTRDGYIYLSFDATNTKYQEYLSLIALQLKALGSDNKYLSLKIHKGSKHEI